MLSMLWHSPLPYASQAVTRCSWQELALAHTLCFSAWTTQIITAAHALAIAALHHSRLLASSQASIQSL